MAFEAWTPNKQKREKLIAKDIIRFVDNLTYNRKNLSSAETSVLNKQIPLVFYQASHPNISTILNYEIGGVIDQLKYVPSVSFAHSISADLGHKRHVSGGVAVVF